MKLHQAMNLAERIQHELAPYCMPGFCQIAGSIRRGRPNVGDIDFVMLPLPGQLHLIKDRCKRRSRVITDGRQNFHFAMQMPADPSINHLENEFEVNIFFARPEVPDLVEPRPTNFGSLLLCRTGSKEHNILLCRRAKDLGMHWNPYEGVFAGGRWEHPPEEQAKYIGGKVIASETEEKVFEALGMKWIAPAFREVGSPGSTLLAAHHEQQPTST